MTTLLASQHVNREQSVIEEDDHIASITTRKQSAKSVAIEKDSQKFTMLASVRKQKAKWTAIEKEDHSASITRKREQSEQPLKMKTMVE